jgi:hypothetical protein
MELLTVVSSFFPVHLTDVDGVMQRGNVASGIASRPWNRESTAIDFVQFLIGKCGGG